MSWWCSASPRNWTWTPRPYVGAWAILLVVVAVALWWVLRGRHQDIEGALPAEPIDDDPDAPVAYPGVTDDRIAKELARGTGPVPSSSTTRTLAFAFGIVGLWACLDWPLATLGAGYLASAQMIRQITMVLIVAPLLLFACPPGLAIRLFGWRRRLQVVRLIARPAFAIPFAALTLVAVNAPAILDPLVATPYGAFGMDLFWIMAGFVLWMPVQCPHPAVHRLTGVNAIAYLIIQSIVPILPGFWMTWADEPIFRTYELAPRAFRGFDAVTDQQTAAAILQVGGMVVLWIQIAYRFLHWGYQQVEQDRAANTITKAPAGTT
ncbi:MAG: cytochrome c oxidase assembly protein [Acidimicrobiales bacterium]